MWRIIILFAILVAAVGSAGAATYYVDDVNGLDDPTRKGGPGDPWRTITYALARVSGENTFMCRGVFEEKVTIEGYGIQPTFIANPEAELKGYITSNVYELKLHGFRVYGYAGIGEHGELVTEDCYFNNPGGPALRAHG